MKRDPILGVFWLCALITLIGLSVHGGKVAAFCLSAGILWMLAGFIYYSVTR